jgi:two-component system response regulator
MHILIIEDNPADAFLTRMALKQAGDEYQSTTFDDGKPAIDYLSDPASRPVDLILLDLNLPCIDGITFLRWLRDRPETADMPVFILSSSPADAFAEAAAVASKYLEKPATLDEYLLIGQVVAEYFVNHKKA